jgi:C-terminal processing protease CtpA/Prc
MIIETLLVTTSLVDAAANAIEQARAARIRKLVDLHFVGRCCNHCGDDCSTSEILQSLDRYSHLLIGPPPSLDFIRGLASEGQEPSVQSNSSGRAYIRLRAFTRRTGHQFESALRSQHGMAMKTLVIDLRDNAGGDLSSALEVAGNFVPHQAPMLELIGRTAVRGYTNPGYPHFTDIRLDVLVNGKTASSAEVLAWLLRYYAGARILGNHTKGKGTVQEIYRVDPQARLVLTTAVYRMPDGSSLDRVGITPDSKQQEMK